MNKRKILTLALAVCMIAILAVGGSLAYLTDTETALNTMVIGNVEIDLDEWTYNNETGEWEAFEDDKFTLYPIDNEQGTKLYNKMVYTANVSSSEDDVYLRNIILIEANANVTAANASGCCFPGIHYGYSNATEPVVSGTDGKTYYGSKEVDTTTETVTINGKEYYVVVFVEAQERAIPYGAALNSLSSVWIDKDVTSAQILGWGDKVEVIAFSQGIQATGLTHAEAMAALGEVNETNLNSWITIENGQIVETAKVDSWTTKTKTTTEAE